MGLTATSFADLVTSTINELGPYNAAQNIAQRKQRYEVLSRWFKDDKQELDSGAQIQRQLMVGEASGGPARHSAVTDEDQVNIADILKTIVVPWVHAETSWAVIRQHVLMNKRPSAILNMIEKRRDHAMLSMHDDMENKAWQAAPLSTNTLDPWGVKYWVVQNQTLGFNGGSPTNDNMIAGLNLSTLPLAGQFNNYSGTYGSATPTDLLPKLRTMHRQVGFMSPVTMKEYNDGSGDSQRIYCNEASISAFEEILSANADLSLVDIAKVDGLNISFRRNPIVWIGALDADTNNPIYMLNHGDFTPVSLDGDFMYENESMAPKNRNIMQYFVDLSYNYLCTNRRGQGVLYQA